VRQAYGSYILVRLTNGLFKFGWIISFGGMQELIRHGRNENWTSMLYKLLKFEATISHEIYT